MIHIPGGTYVLGTRPERARELAARYGFHPSWLEADALRDVRFEGFEIDEVPVTNARYAEFCKATGHQPSYVDGPPDHPVTGVPRPDAEAFAAWAGCRLPTQDEWEAAARGTDGREWPWGDEFDPTKCRFDAASTAPAGAYPAGASPFGVLHMAGNVAEWCAGGPGPQSAWVAGGAFLHTNPALLRPASRWLSGWERNALPFVGFRCAR